MVRANRTRGVLGLLVSATVGIGAWCDIAAEDLPNVLLVYTDDQGYGDASCLNPDSRFATPNIDRLAREGMRFSDGHASDTVCTPSRYGLLTGRYSWRTTLKRGVLGAEGVCLIADDRPTIATLLSRRGYQSALIGKWHLGMQFPGERGERDWTQATRDMPLDKGFDVFWGIPASMNYGVLAWFDGRFPLTAPTLFTRKKENGLALSDYRIVPPYDPAPRRPNDLEVAPDFEDAACLSRFTEQAVDRIEAWAEPARNGRPFLIVVSYTSPHKPVIPVERFRGLSQAGAYGDFMMETDWHLGRLLDALEREGIAGNTLVFFSSDNGPENTWRQRQELFGHRSSGMFREGKRSIYEGGHRVPFLVRWPARVRAGSSWSQPVCQTDLYATLAEATGIELSPGEGEDSISFFPILVGESPDSPRPPLIHHSARGRFAIRSGPWKLVMETPTADRELYQLDEDPGESRNLIRNRPQVAAELESRITRIITAGFSRPGAAGPNDTPPWDDLVWISD